MLRLRRRRGSQTIKLCIDTLFLEIVAVPVEFTRENLGSLYIANNTWRLILEGFAYSQSLCLVYGTCVYKKYLLEHPVIVRIQLSCSVSSPFQHVIFTCMEADILDLATSREFTFPAHIACAWIIGIVGKSSTCRIFSLICWKPWFFKCFRQIEFLDKDFR